METHKSQRPPPSDYLWDVPRDKLPSLLTTPILFNVGGIGGAINQAEVLTLSLANDMIRFGDWQERANQL